MRVYRPGTLFANRYEVQDLLGVGPVAVTYLALERQQPVALKVFHEEIFASDSERAAFLFVMQRLKEQDHPNIREIYDIEAQDLVYYTSPYCEGGSLRQSLRARRSVTLPEVEPLFWHLCVALSAAGVRHGGLRPENLLLSPGAARISDLALYSALPAGKYFQALQETNPGYLAPEVNRAEDISKASDVYSLGAILYEMLSGRTYSPAASPSLSRELQASPALDELLEKALSLAPHTRHRDAAEFMQHLRQVTRRSLKGIETKAALSPALKPSEPAKATTPDTARVPQVVPQPAPEPIKLPEATKPKQSEISTKPQISLKPLSKPTESNSKINIPIRPEAKPGEPLSKVGIQIRPEIAPKPQERPPSAVLQRPLSSESKPLEVKPKPPESGLRPLASKPDLPLPKLEVPSKINIPIRPEPQRPQEAPSKPGISLRSAFEPPKPPERTLSTPGLKAISQEEPKPKPPENAEAKQAQPSPKPPKPSPTPPPKPAEPLDPEPTQVSAKIPEAFAALLAAEAEAEARARGEKPPQDPVPLPPQIDPALVLLRPLDAPTKQPEPSAPKPPEPARPDVSARLAQVRAQMSEPVKNPGIEPTVSTRLPAVPPAAESPEPLDPTKPLVKSAPPEPTSLIQKPGSRDPNADSKPPEIAPPRILELREMLPRTTELPKPERPNKEAKPEARPKEPARRLPPEDELTAPPKSIVLPPEDFSTPPPKQATKNASGEAYPSVDSFDLFVDIEELELEPEEGAQPQRKDLIAALAPAPKPPEQPEKTHVWATNPEHEDGETTGIRPLPSRRAPALSLEGPGDDLFSSGPPVSSFDSFDSFDSFEPTPTPPPFEPPEKK